MKSRVEQWWEYVMQPIVKGFLEEFPYHHSQKCPAFAKLGTPEYDPALCDREVCLIASGEGTGRSEGPVRGGRAEAEARQREGDGRVHAGPRRTS
jgi:hypothetical protein